MSELPTGPAPAAAQAAPVPATPAGAPANPYPGLRAFARSESDLFFGRQQQIAALAARLDAGARFVAVAGASGCGKSSLVLAGVLPALLRRRTAEGRPAWKALELRPGNRPIANLAAALVAHLRPGADAFAVPALEGRLRLSSVGLDEAVRASGLEPGTRVLVVVDQFEELFRFRSMADPQESAAFVKLLLHAVGLADGAVAVVITLRSDMLGYCADYEGLPEAISDGQVLVPRLTREQRREAIVGPAQLRGRDIAPSLVQRLLNDVSNSFDDLPVMQHALTRTWQAWVAAGAPERSLDLADYRAIGGAPHALSRHADEIVAELTKADKALGAMVERVFRALTERIVDGTEVRRSLPWDRLVAICGGNAAAVATVVDRFRRGDAALLLPAASVPLASNPPIDISHESLIRGWDALRGWAEVESSAAQTYRRLATAARLHAEGKEALLQDPGLSIALAWRQHDAPNEAWAQLYGGGFGAAMRYLDDSATARDLEKTRRAAAETSRRRLRDVVKFTVLAAAIGMGWLAYTNWQALEALRSAEADKERARALTQAIADSGQLAQLANAERLEGRLDLALLYGAAAVGVHPGGESLDVLRRMLQNAPARLLDAQEALSRVEFAPDGKHLLGLADSGALVVWNAADGKEAGRLDAEGSESGRPGREAGFDAGGRIVATPASDEKSIFWTDFGAAPERPPGKPDGTRIVTALDAGRHRMAFTLAEGGPVHLWDLAAGQATGTLDAGGATATGLAFSPDGQRLAMADAAGGVRVWELAPGRPPGARMLRARGESTYGLLFSPDGRWLVCAELKGDVVLWDLRARAGAAAGRRLVGSDKEAQALAFDPAGRRLAAAGAGGSVPHWSTETGERLDAGASPHRAAVRALAFSADGKLLASGGSESFVVLWDGQTGVPMARRLRAHRSELVSLAFAPDAPRLASAAQDGVVALWDLDADARRLGTLLRDDRTGLTSLAYSPDGKWVAAGHESGRMVLWSTSGPTDRSIEQRVHLERLGALAYSPKGRYIATAGDDRRIVLIDPTNGESRDLWSGGTDDRPATAITFAGGERWVVSGAEDGRLTRWDTAADGAGRVFEGAHLREVLALAASRDGSLVASAGRDRKVRLWDAQALRMLKVFDEGAAEMTAVAFTPDGRTLVAAGQDGLVHVWDIAEREWVRKFGHRGIGVRTLAVSPDGKSVAVGDVDGAVTLWSLAEGRALHAPLPVHRNVVTALAYAPDGRTLAAGSRFAGLLLWDADPGSWAEQACAVAGRDLTREDLPLRVVVSANRPSPCAKR